MCSNAFIWECGICFILNCFICLHLQERFSVKKRQGQGNVLKPVDCFRTSGGLPLSHPLPCWAQGQGSLRASVRSGQEGAHVLPCRWADPVMRDTGHRVDSVQRCAHRGTVRELQEELIYPANPEEGTVRPDTGQGPSRKLATKKKGAGVMPLIWGRHQSIL